MFFKKIWTYFQNLGINASLSEQDIRLTRMINSFCFGLFLVVLLSFIFQSIKHLILSGHILKTSYLMLLSFLPLIFVFILNAQRKYFTARLFLILFPMVNILSWMFTYPAQQGNIHHTLIILCIPITILFKKNSVRIGLVFVTFISFVMAFLIKKNYPSTEIQYFDPYFEIFLFSIWLILSFLMLGIFLSEINTTQNELKLKNKELEELAHISSHDLKEPLRTIGNFSHLIRTKHKDQINSEVDEYLGFIESGIDRMNVLLTDLTNFSLLSEFDKTMVSKVDLNQVLHSVCKDLDASIKSSKAEITSTELPTVNANSSHMYQLFQNLISNAIKFQPKDNSHIPCIELEAKRENNFIHLTFKDNGIGIPSEFQDIIFTKFKRLNNQSEYLGTGLGLTTSKKIVEYYHGQIKAETNSSGGTTFFVKLMQ